MQEKIETVDFFATKYTMIVVLKSENYSIATHINALGVFCTLDFANEFVYDFPPITACSMHKCESISDAIESGKIEITCFNQCLTL